MGLNLGLENLKTVKVEQLPSQEDLMFAVEVLSTRLAIANLSDIEKNIHNIKTIVDTTKKFNTDETKAFAQELLGCSVEAMPGSVDLYDEESSGKLGKSYHDTYEKTRKSFAAVYRRAMSKFNEAEKAIQNKKANTQAVAKFRQESAKLLKVLSYAKDAISKASNRKKPDNNFEASHFTDMEVAACKLYKLSKDFLAGKIAA